MYILTKISKSMQILPKNSRSRRNHLIACGKKWPQRPIFWMKFHAMVNLRKLPASKKYAYWIKCALSKVGKQIPSLHKLIWGVGWVELCQFSTDLMGFKLFKETKLHKNIDRPYLQKVVKVVTSDNPLLCKTYHNARWYHSLPKWDILANNWFRKIQLIQ